MKKILLLLTMFSVVVYGELKYEYSDKERLNKVEEFVNNALIHGKSKNNPTPLIADGINTLTYEPVKWIYPSKKEVSISNFASQQNFLKILQGLTAVTGDEKYLNTAKETTKYFLNNYTSSNNLFYWGGHRFINLDTGELEGPQNKNEVHELKTHFPDYDFLYKVDNQKTVNYIKSFWNAHVENWKTMDMSRHGSYSKKYDDKLFLKPIPKDVVDIAKLPIMPKTKGLTFINAGSDLIYAAYKLDELNGETGAKEWGKFLAKQYKLAHNPRTGAPVYQFSSPIRRETPPKDDANTDSKYGDRAQRQFGTEFGDIAQEGNALFKGTQRAIVVENALVELDIAEKTRDKEMLEWAVNTLKNFYKIAFNYETGEIIPMWNDGTSMENYVLPRDGYYGKKGTKFKASRPNQEDYMLPLVKGYRLSGDIELWKVARVMGINFKLGDIGENPNTEPKLQMDTKNNSPYAIFTLLELYGSTKNKKYIDLARIVGDNIIKDKFKRGYFLEHETRLNAKIDSLEALAIVTLDGVLKGKEKEIPVYMANGGYIHGEYFGNSNTYDTEIIYKQKIN